MTRDELLRTYNMTASVPADKDARATLRGHVEKHIIDLMNRDSLTDKEAKDFVLLRDLNSKIEELNDKDQEPVRKLYTPTSQGSAVMRPGFINPKGRDILPQTVDSYQGDYDAWVKDALSRQGNPRLFETRTSSGISGVAGGFAIPSPLANLVWDAGLEDSLLLQRLQVFPMTAPTLDIAAFDGEAHNSVLFGGFSAQWLGETDAATESDCRLRAITLTAHKIAIYSGFSHELWQDAPALSGTISGVLSRALRFELEDVVLHGSGIGRPLGILQSASRISVSRAGAGAIAWADLVGMRTRLYPGFTGSAIWIIHPAVLGELLVMEDTGGSLIWTGNPGSVASGQPSTLMGLPVMISEKASDLGTEGDVILLDPGKYALGVREGLFFETSNSPAWSQAITSFRMLGRFAGQPLLDSTITPRRGANSLGWCVTLAA